MARKLLVIVTVLILVIPRVTSAQLKEQDKSKISFSDALTMPRRPQAVLGLIGFDPTRFHMSQSYTLGYSRYGGQGSTSGLYLNTMHYQFSDPLGVSVQLGYLHSPFSTLSGGNESLNNMFVSGARLEYKPSETFGVRLEYSAYPRGMYPHEYGTPYDHGWSPISMTHEPETDPEP